MSTEDDNNTVNYEGFDIEPTTFLDIKKGVELKNKKVLKSKLSEIDSSIAIAEKELYLILYYAEVIMEDRSNEGIFGDDSEAIDSLNDVMQKCSDISDLLDEIKDIKEKL
mgnify:CR=1 FL=1